MKATTTSVTPHFSYNLFLQMMGFIEAIAEVAKGHYWTKRTALVPCLTLPTVEGIVLTTRGAIPAQIITPWGRTDFIDIRANAGDTPFQEFLDGLIQQHELVTLHPLIAIKLGLDPNEDEEAHLFVATDEAVKRDHAQVVLEPATRPPTDELRSFWQRHMDEWQAEQQNTSHMAHRHELHATVTAD